jgi:uncharacterized protein (DUF1499 family)
MRRLIVEEPYAAPAVWSRRLAFFALVVAAIGVVSARSGLDPTPVLAIMGSSFAIACIAILCAGAAIIVIWQTGRKGTGLLLAGLILASLLLGYPGFLAVQAVRLPVLADVSTDIDDPPAFGRSKNALAARGGVTPEAVPTELRHQQKQAYPNVQPIILDLDVYEAYKAVLKVANAKHWQIVEQVPPGPRSGGVGHIDAVVRGLVLGLRDDVTIRIRPLAGQTRVDMRSASRIGRHDFGSNASRIEQFAAALQAEADSN